MDYARSAIGKHSRMAAASASATSRKNKLQRCSQCGGLGHKSRTCENSKSLQPQDLSDDCLSPTSSPDRRRVTFADDFDDISDARAAYLLVDMSKSISEESIDLDAVFMPPPPQVQAPLPPPPPQQLEFVQLSAPSPPPLRAPVQTPAFLQPYNMLHHAFADHHMQFQAPAMSPFHPFSRQLLMT